MVFLVLAVLVAAVSAATVWLAATRPRRENDPDAAFWYAFTGLCVLLPLVLVPATANKAESVGLLAVAAAAALASHHLTRRNRILAEAEQGRTVAAGALAAVTGAHSTLLARWSRYELDPAASIDFPAMTDVRVPETQALIRAVTAAAATQRDAMQGGGPDDGVAEYRRSVAELAAALETAERAAGSTPGAMR